MSKIYAGVCHICGKPTSYVNINNDGVFLYTCKRWCDIKKDSK